MQDLLKAFQSEADELAQNLKEVAHETPVPKKQASKAKQVEEEKFNAARWLIENLEGRFWRCALSWKIYATDDGTELDELKSNSLYLNLKMQAPINKEDLYSYLNSEYVPSRNVIGEFLEALPTKYKGEPIKDLFSCLRLNEQKNFEVLHSIFRKWFIGVVSQAREMQFFPNTLCPVIVSDVNKGKTSFWRRLTFGTDLHDYTTIQRLEGKFDKDTQTTFAGYLLICLDDLDKSDFKKNSAFRTLISAEKFEFRPPFGKFYTKRQRLASLCGTTNDRDIISDAQNNRRIVPIEITEIDFELLDTVKSLEVWAEAVEAYKEGEDWTLTDREVAFIQSLSLRYTPTTGLGDYILQHIAPCEKDKNALFASASDLYAVYIATNQDLNKNVTLDRFAEVLRKSGFVYASKRVEGKQHPVKGYYYTTA